MDEPEFRAAVESWSSSTVRGWDADWRELLFRWAEPELALVGDASWGAAVRDAVGLPVQDPLRWANRVVELPSGGWAVTGIRFRGRDLAKPFVDVIATSVAPDASGLAELGATLDAHAEFAPLCFRVALPGDARGDQAPVSSAFAARPDQLVVAAPLAAIRARQPVSGSVELRATSAESAAARVRSMYDDVRVHEPRLDQWATPSDVATLQDAEEEGLLFDVVIEGRVAGVVAASREDARGFTGYSVEEIVLDDAHRGRGYGPVVLHCLADRLPDGGSDVLWGHINAGNTRSLRNALASGRVVTSTLVWVAPDGSPGMPES
ncbi:hypothetical protein GA0004736_0519 [Curtobacterium sp. 9128]|uniref:GNAT family N-acetyltransferase n=1 Tax=Curtobacterium sp. 9128 TaxID=1793722 RepID=UPI0007D7250D|nr:GNAT family N-acetyltransferase [Curtobacterium sp. 9128]SBN61632.1 hypothetical protein GA0004736_0519 [Curtobacterium sp. 9128]